jgi:hypothetical protein
MESRPKSQNPNTKLQRNPKHQVPKLAIVLTLGIWSFSGVWSLDLGAFIFGQR